MPKSLQLSSAGRLLDLASLGAHVRERKPDVGARSMKRMAYSLMAGTVARSLVNWTQGKA